MASGPSRQTVIVDLPAAVSATVIGKFAALLLVLQLLSGTDPLYALLVALFVVVTGVAFNLSGGFHTIPGFCIAMMALKAVLVSQVAKLCLWQPGDSFLEAPHATILVFIVGFASMVLGVLVAGGGRLDRPWLRPIHDATTLRTGAIVCGVIGLFSAAVLMRSGIDTSTEQHTRGGLVGLSHILVRALPLSIVFATSATIARSNGARSVSWLVLTTFALAFGYAAVEGTKSGVFEAGLYYLLTCFAWRFAFRRTQLAALVIVGIVALVLIWPLIQSVKNIVALRSISIAERVELMRETLGEIDSVADYFETQESVAEAFAVDARFQYYGRPNPVLDRFSLIEPADELVAVTQRLGEVGWFPIKHAFHGLVPSFIDPTKPVIDTGNFFGHRIAYLTPTDDETQISFGILPQSFAAFAWTGVLVIPAILMFWFVHVIGRLGDGFLFNVWTVYLFGRLQHYFVEQSISNMVREMFVLPLFMFTVASAVRLAIRVPDMLKHKE